MKGGNSIVVFVCDFVYSQRDEREEKMNKVQKMLTGKMNSQNYNPKNVKCFSTTATACVIALTFGVGVMLNILTVGAAGQVIGGYTAGNQALGDGSVVVSGGKDKAPNLAEGENSAVLGEQKI